MAPPSGLAAIRSVADHPPDVYRGGLATCSCRAKPEPRLHANEIFFYKINYKKEGQTQPQVVIIQSLCLVYRTFNGVI